MKKMRVRIKIKNKLEDKLKFSVWGLNWNKKEPWQKERQIKRKKVKLEKIEQYKLWLKDEIQNQ
jgi:hypothetical protein